jgi:hypothetical protein|tara:strand:- start:3798 stop:4346 length:549 start_codon:yes stop_codon:yes gene_type:complete
MGGSSPTYTQEKIYMPKPTAPRQYRTYVPFEDMQKVADFGKRLDEQTAALQQDRFREVGTPSEIGARSRGRELRENAAYLASLPGQMKDPGLMGINKDAFNNMVGQQPSQIFQPGTTGEAITSAKQNFGAAKTAFEKAQKVKGEKAQSLVDPTAFKPMYAAGTKEEFDEVYRMRDLGETKKA